MKNLTSQSKLEKKSVRYSFKQNIILAFDPKVKFRRLSRKSQLEFSFEDRMI